MVESVLFKASLERLVGWLDIVSSGQGALRSTLSFDYRNADDLPDYTQKTHPVVHINHPVIIEHLKLTKPETKFGGEATSRRTVVPSPRRLR